MNIFSERAQSGVTVVTEDNGEYSAGSLREADDYRISVRSDALSIRGAIRSMVTGRLLAGVRVEARSATRRNTPGIPAGGITDDEGAYEITGLMRVDPWGDPVDD